MKKKLNVVFGTLCGLLIMTSCVKDRSDKEFYAGPTICDTEIMVNDSTFQMGETDSFAIINALIDGDCLKVEFYANGCNGSTWDAQLVMASNAFEQDYVNTRILLQNSETCDGVYSKIFVYDLKPMRISTSNSINIELAGWNGSWLYYEY